MTDLVPELEQLSVLDADELEQERLERLPLPGDGEPFAERVDQYTQVHGISRAETFRRIAAETSNSPKGLALRYREKGDKCWWSSEPTWLSLMGAVAAA